MLLKLKLRIGGILLVVGGLLAIIGEILNTGNNNPMQSGWFFSMILVALGLLVLAYGINIYAQLSENVHLFGLLGSTLVFLGSLVGIIGIIAVDVVIVPMLLGMAQSIATVINAPGSAAQNATNTVSSGLNNLGNGIAGLFGQSTPDIPSVQVPQVNGLDIVNKTLVDLHLPAFIAITHWGHFFFAGGPLIPGCLLLGIALARVKGYPRLVSYALIAGAILDTLGLLLPTVPILGNITSILLFISLALPGATLLFPERIARLSRNIPAVKIPEPVRR